MKYFKIAGLCLASMLVMSMALAGNASAAPLWLLCLEGKEGATPTKYTTNQCTKAAAANEGKWESVAIGSKSDTVKLLGLTILLRDSNALAGSSGVRCGHPTTGWGLIEGPNKLIIKVAKVEKPKTECERVEGGCKAGEVEKVEGVDLPWKEEVYETEGKLLSMLEGDGNGEPGWEVECKTLLEKQKDICKSEKEKPELLNGENTLTSEVLLVLATFLGRRNAECSQGGKEKGSVSGQIAILLWNGFGLSLNKV